MWRVALDRSGGLSFRGVVAMATRKEMSQPSEPLGIVISNGNREEPSPLFWAYEWSEVPEASVPPSKKRVA
jgi:hypothetical protein